MASLVEQFENLEMIENTWMDTALYGLSPAPTDKRGYPKKRGQRILLEEIIFNSPKSGDWLIGMMPVITTLWKGKMVYTLVTVPKTGKEAVVYFCARLIPKTFVLTGRTAWIKQPVIMEKKMSFICH